MKARAIVVHGKFFPQILDGTYWQYLEDEGNTICFSKLGKAAEYCTSMCEDVDWEGPCIK